MAKRNIVVSFHRPRSERKNAPDTPHVLQGMRHYVRVTTAIPRAIFLLLGSGQPGGRVEVAHAEHGFQIAVITVHVGGSIDIRLSDELANHKE